MLHPAVNLATGRPQCYRAVVTNGVANQTACLGSNELCDDDFFNFLVPRFVPLLVKRVESKSTTPQRYKVNGGDSCQVPGTAPSLDRCPVQALITLLITTISLLLYYYYYYYLSWQLRLEAQRAGRWGSRVCVREQPE